MKDTYYFSHDYNARSDGKLIKVAMKHGMEGIGAYWCIIEMLYEEGGYLNIDEYERITFELRVSYDLVNSLINNFGLFEKDNKVFWSNSVLDRLKQRMEKSEKARESINKRWNKNKEEDTNVLRTKNESNTIKERKEKNNKENKENEFEKFISDEWNVSITYYIIKYFLSLGWKPAEDETVETLRKWITDVMKENGIDTGEKMKSSIDKWYEYWKTQKKPKNIKSTFRNTIKFSK